MNRSQKAALSGDSAFGHVKGPHDAVGFCANLRGGDGGAQFRLPRARLQGGLSSGQSRFARLTKGCQRRFLLIKQLVHGSQLLLLHTRIHADQQLTRTHRLPLAHIHFPHPARLQGDEGLFIRVGDNPLQQSGADQFPTLHHRGAHGCPGCERQQKQRDHGCRRGRNYQQGRLGFRHACVSSLPAPHGALKGYCGLFAGCEPWQVHAAWASFNKRRRARGTAALVLLTAWTCSGQSADASCGYRSAFR